MRKACEAPLWDGPNGAGGYSFNPVNSLNFLKILRNPLYKTIKISIYSEGQSYQPTLSQEDFTMCYTSSVVPGTDKSA